MRKVLRFEDIATLKQIYLFESSKYSQGLGQNKKKYKYIIFSKEFLDKCLYFK